MQIDLAGGTVVVRGNEGKWTGSLIFFHSGRIPNLTYAIMRRLTFFVVSKTRVGVDWVGIDPYRKLPINRKPLRHS